MKKSNYSRRDTIKIGLAGTAAALAGSAAQAAEDKKTDVWIFKGKDNTKLMQECMKVIAKNGGFGKAKTMALKVNTSWARTPKQGANTDPELVAEFLRLSKEAGITRITIPEISCDPPKDSFKMSGISDAAGKHGAKMVDLKSNGKFKTVQIPNGKKITKSPVATDILEADVVINMPVAKNHRVMTLTCAMKNWMGIVENRREWHRLDLPQCIVDFTTFIKPAWTIIDATRVMTTKGPKGPGKLKSPAPEMVILSRCPVAADAYASRFLVPTPTKIPYLNIAKEMKLGVIDEAQMNIRTMDVS